MLANIRNLDYVVLLCEDMERMRVFYHETMGLSIYRDLDGGLELQVGATLLTLRRRGRPYDGQKIPDSAAIQLAFRVAPAEVDACHAELLRKQVEILEAPRDQD
jgi:lactoylglutathione lyase